MTTLAQYRNMLRVNKHRLDDELEIQAELQDRINQEVNLLNSRAIEAKEDLARTDARLSLQLKDSGDKMTVGELADRVKIHRDHVTAFEKWQSARLMHEEWDSLLNAWKVKGFTLRDLGALFVGEYFSLTSIITDGHQTRTIDTLARARVREASQNASPAPSTTTTKRVLRR